MGWWYICDKWSSRYVFILQGLVARLKENLEKLTEERDQRSASENREKEQNKRLLRQIRDIKEEMGELAKKESEASRKKHELVRRLNTYFTLLVWDDILYLLNLVCLNEV